MTHYRLPRALLLSRIAYRLPRPERYHRMKQQPHPHTLATASSYASRLCLPELSQNTANEMLLLRHYQAPRIQQQPTLHKEPSQQGGKHTLQDLHQTSPPSQTRGHDCIAGPRMWAFISGCQSECEFAMWFTEDDRHGRKVDEMIAARWGDWRGARRLRAWS